MRSSILSFAVLAAGCAPGPAPTAPAPPSSLHGLAQAAGGFATSVDARGVPTFIRAAGAEAPPVGTSAAGAALYHAARFAPALAVSPEALAAAEPVLVADHGRAGTVVQLRQRVGGVEVYGRELRVLLRPDQSLVALAGGLHPSLPRPGTIAFLRAPEEALAAAVAHATGAAISPASVIDLHDVDGDRARYQLAPGDIVLSEGALVRKVLFPVGERLRPAFAMDFYAGRADSTDAAAWRYVVAAADGSLLERRDLTQYDAFNYRVWAFTSGDLRPSDGPAADWTPHPTGIEDWSTPPFTVPSVIGMEGFNRKPNKPDPWLPPTAVDTQGNNADAYVDLVPPNGASIGAGDFRADVTGPKSFDRVYDLFKSPTASADQAKAGIVQAFYDVNWLHDFWYDSGFNEAAGNAQKSNFNRGGAGNDPIKVETQDYSGRDNSNMSTPGDGMSPRMQLYVWSGRETRTLHVTPPDAELTSSSAVFGPVKFDVSGQLVDVDDGTFPSVTDGCEAIRNDVTGKIAVIDRGSCTFKRKVVNAEAAGAIGVLIVNNINGNPPRMGNGDPVSTDVSIPVLATTKQSGAQIRDLLTMGAVNGHLARSADIDRDGALDNSVIFHEWGHYLHHRLADCGNAQQCNAMSEGWADFDSLITILRDGDDLDGTYAVGIYASAQFDDPAYFGIRRQPYTVDFNKNALTFRCIGDDQQLPPRQLRAASQGGGTNSEVHNAGEIWATMMWEAYVALQKAGSAKGLTFEQVRRNMAEYVVTGLQMTPPDATYLEQLDAVIAAAAAADPDDEQTIAQAFARRGAGTCADGPPRTSVTLEGVIEGFTVQPRLVIGDVTLDDSPSAMSGMCDGDGVLDAGEYGRITLHVANGALTTLSGASVDLATDTPGITFAGDSHFTLPDLAPFASATLTTIVALDARVANPGTFVLRVTPSQNAACPNGGAREIRWKINYDVGSASSTTDDVEEPGTAWVTDGDGATDIWSRIPAEDQNHVWHAADTSGPSDTSLESPDLVVSTSDFFILRFEHRFTFDAADSGGSRVYHDGGVIELSDDGGMSWKDVSTWVNPQYGGVLDNTPGNMNALAGRRAFVDKSFAWPDRERVTLNFLDQLAGKTVRVRFRMATDGLTGAPGWEIDNVSFQGITNTPFDGATFDAGKCGVGPRGPAAHDTGGCSVSGKTTSTFALALAALAVIALRRRRRQSTIRS